MKNNGFVFSIVAVLISVLIAEAAGAIGSIFTVFGIKDWYVYLEKPFFSPPNWIFGPVWTALYFLMGVAAYLVWKERKNIEVREALFIYGGQLVLNAFWSVIFFGFRNIGGAFLEIIFLWGFVLATMIYFARVSKIAAWFLLPYILWVSFAAVLNFSLWILNGW